MHSLRDGRTWDIEKLCHDTVSQQAVNEDCGLIVRFWVDSIPWTWEKYDVNEFYASILIDRTVK